MDISTKNLYWVGPRLSDIDGIKALFNGAIVIFGTESASELFYCKPLYSTIFHRINHNDNRYESLLNDYHKNEFEKILNDDSEAHFLWYNGIPPPHCDTIIKNKSICTNSTLIINQFSDKLKSRLLLSEYVPVLQSKFMLGIDCSYDNMKSLFPTYCEFILQIPVNSYGGFATHIMTSENKAKVYERIKYNDLLVSPYHSKNVSVNQHIVIYPNEIVIFPFSCQIIQKLDDKLQYNGGDFNVTRNFGKTIIELINSYTNKIGTILQRLGYRGVAGIDYLILPNNSVLFLEINTRFQASTIALNRALIEAKLPSVHEYHIESFYVDNPINRYKMIDKIDYSICSFLYSGKEQASALIKRINTYDKGNLEKLYDGTIDNLECDDNAYLFRTLIKSNISSIYDDRLIVHPNIFPQTIDIENNFILIKIGLLVHGVRLDYQNLPIKLKKAVGSAFDLCFDNGLYVNAYVNTLFSNLSPFELIWHKNNKFKLLYNDKFIANVKIDEYDESGDLVTKNGFTYYFIAQFFTDRLRINPFSVCDYGALKKACKFCDLGNCSIKRKQYSINDIYEVIDHYVMRNSIRHFLIGGGTSLKEGSWEIILSIVKYIRSKTDMDIYLMSIPPPSNILFKLYEAGVTEIGFNLELFDREIAMDIMPAKGLIPIEEYFHALEEAVKIWGKYGAVRSLLMVGIEPIHETLKGVEELCKRGVMPILSIFRPMPNTPMQKMIPLNFNDVYDLWVQASNICKYYDLILGPKCIPCQNNTLSFPNAYCC